MALSEDQKKLLIGGGIGALALAIGFVIFGGKAAATPAPVFQSPQRGQFPQRFQPSQRVPMRDLERTRKKRRHDDDNERGNRGDRDRNRGDRDRGENGRGENGRGEYSSKKRRRSRRGD